MSTPAPLFLSFKLEEANLVREVAELLQVVGLPVWFCEYEIHERDEDGVVAALDQALATCASAVVFLSRAYLRARFCEHELSSLRQRFSQGGEVFVVELESTGGDLPTTWSSLASQDPVEIVEAVLAWRGVPAEGWRPVDPREPASRAVSAYPQVGFDTTGLLLLRNGTLSDGISEIGAKGRADGVWLNLHFVADKRQLVKGDPARMGRHMPAGLESRDWATYTRAREELLELQLETMARHVADARRTWSDTELMGLHLVMVGGQPQFAGTYRQNGATLRKYSVLVDHPEHGPFELIFTFGVPGEPRDFWRAAGWMDRVVSGIDLSAEGQTTTPRMVPGCTRPVVVAGLLVLAGVLGWVVFAMSAG